MDAFEVTYVCGNCGREFCKGYGTQIVIKKHWNHVEVCGLRAGIDCTEVVCPCCGLQEAVNIKRRRPRNANAAVQAQDE